MSADHHERMKRDVHATYERMDRGELAYEDGITELIQISDDHIEACKVELAKRRGGAR